MDGQSCTKIDTNLTVQTAEIQSLTQIRIVIAHIGFHIFKGGLISEGILILARSSIRLRTVFPHMVAAATILFSNCKTLKFSNSFRV
jgi:hypothetical protein